MFSEEFNLKSTTPHRYKWLFGAFGFWQGIDNTVILDYLAQKYTTRKIYDTPTYGFALYHQSTFDDLLFDGLSATFGIRYDYERASTDFRGSYGMATIVVYTTAMDCVRPGREGTDFTVQTVITHLSGMLMAILSGKIADHTGYHGLFFFEVSLALLSLVYILTVFRKEKETA